MKVYYVSVFLTIFDFMCGNTKENTQKYKSGVLIWGTESQPLLNHESRSITDNDIYLLKVIIFFGSNKKMKAANPHLKIHII